MECQKKISRKEDIELNEKGKEQACVVANYLKKSEWNIIISSPLNMEEKEEKNKQFILNTISISIILALVAYIVLILVI